MKTAATRTARPARSGQKRKRATETPVAAAAVVAPAAVAEPVVAPVVDTSAEIAVSEATRAGDSVVAMASNCTVKDAAAMKVSLCAVADAAGAVVIDAGAVERIDTAVLQLLIAFVRERLGNDREVTWRAPSAALLSSARLLGVSDLLTLPNSAAGAC
jgi:ABC-type transporter Mla MlaB component